jgi:hypothetical protein
MAITAQSIIRRVVETLNDTTSIRWPVNELVRYLNDGQREVVQYRPDAMVTNSTLTLVAGAKQALPSNGSKLLDIVRNNSQASKRAVRMTNRMILDAQVPNWHNLTGATEILHFTYDPRDPRVFYVYPPAAASGAVLDIIYSAYPAALTEPADGSTFAAVTGDISVPDIHANALADYVLYRAYSKDTEYAGNAARATAHYQAFTNAMTVEANATAVATPKA